MSTQLNENNVYLTQEAVCEMFRKLNISNFQINDLANYQQAFIHRSYVRKMSFPTENPDLIPFQLESNEVLEFEGDSILGSYVARYLHHRYPDEQEGFLTTLKSRLVKTESLAKFASFLDFGKWLVISKYVEEQNGRENPKLLENTFEAFIGAIYRDNGDLRLDPISLLLPHQLICNIMELTVNFGTLNKQDDNYKDQLMRAFHREFKGKHATYSLIKTEGQSNNCIFTCGVVHPLYPDVIVSQATGRKKPHAEQAAAKIALEKLDWIINYKPPNRHVPKNNLQRPITTNNFRQQHKKYNNQPYSRQYTNNQKGISRQLVRYNSEQEQEQEYPTYDDEIEDYYNNISD